PRADVRRRTTPMPRTRYRLAVVAVAALAAAGVARFVNGSQASTGQRQALPAATVSATDPSPEASPGPTPDTAPAPTTTTTAAPPQIHAILSPGDGEVVGVGMPAVVTFDRPVAAADRPAVEAR